MSLTLLVQLLGRGMRLLKPEQIAAGYKKEDHLVLDFTGTMFELGSLYEDPILEEAEAKKEERRLSQERAFLEANRLKQKALEEARHTAPTKERAFDFVLPEGDEWEELGVADLDFRRKPETKIAPKFVSVTDNTTRSGRSYTEEELKQQIKD